MFDIGFPELILLCVVTLLILGPERMPEVVRTLGLWLGRLRRSFHRIKTEIEREVGMEDVRRQLYNESLLQEVRNVESEVKRSTNIDTRSPAAGKGEAGEDGAARTESPSGSAAGAGERDPAEQSASGEPAGESTGEAAGDSEGEPAPSRNDRNS